MKNDVKITVFDTPGLADGTGQDEEYLRKIQEKESKFDLFLFCTELNTVRFRSDDLETMKKLTSTLGLQLWDHGVVIFTFANEVRPSPSKKAKNVSEKDFFSDRFRGFKRKIQESLVDLGVPEEAAANVPFVPAGDLSEPRLPDRDNWLTAFWVAAFKRINRKARSAFFIANVDRFSFTSDPANLEGDLGSGESKKNCGSLHNGPSPEEVDAMKALKRKFQKISFDKQLGSCLLKGRVYDEEGNKTSLPNDQDVKPTVSSAIEMDESTSQDLIQEMFGDTTSSLIGHLITSTFERFHKRFFKWFLKARVAAIKEKARKREQVERGEDKTETQ